jgi:hypothetical protein
MVTRRESEERNDHVDATEKTVSTGTVQGEWERRSVLLGIDIWSDVSRLDSRIISGI